MIFHCEWWMTELWNIFQNSHAFGSSTHNFSSIVWITVVTPTRTTLTLIIIMAWFQVCRWKLHMQLEFWSTLIVIDDETSQFHTSNPGCLIRSRTTLKFWSATMFGAAARYFEPVHKFELPTVIADSVPRATRVFSLASVGHVTGHMVSHMVPMARSRPPYWKIFTVNNLAAVF